MQLSNQTDPTPPLLPYPLFFCLRIFITINAKIIQIRLVQRKERDMRSAS